MPSELISQSDLIDTLCLLKQMNRFALTDIHDAIDELKEAVSKLCNSISTANLLLNQIHDLARQIDDQPQDTD